MPTKNFMFDVRYNVPTVSGDIIFTVRNFFHCLLKDENYLNLCKHNLGI